jgi:hypothetical protein
MTKYLLNGFNNLLRHTVGTPNSERTVQRAYCISRTVLHLFRYFHSLHPYLIHKYDFTYYIQ